MSSATVVLVHGAGGGAWAWELVTAELDKLGIAHREVDLPSSGLTRPPDAGVAGDTAVVRELLDTLEAPVVLVGHSYGGTIISSAAVDHPAVARLVYVAAQMPEPGIPLVNQLVGTEESNAATVLMDDGRASLDPDVAVSLAFQQADPETAKWAVARMRPTLLSAIMDVQLPAVAWQGIPSTYVVCTEDRMIPPAYQQQWATERATAKIEVPYDHAPVFSHPAELAQLLADIAAEVPPATAGPTA
jgi:pimeloyl-ACP methyl ester carboxylesterase